MLKTIRYRTLAVAALTAAALFAAGCGGSDDATPAGAGTTTMTETTMTQSSQTIVDVAAANPDFSILVAAVKKAGLADTLSGAGPFTVFAPTNAAFEAALKATGLTQEQLLASPDLGKILTYHVLPAKVMASAITGTSDATTVEGSTVKVALDGSTVKVGPTAKVTAADVAASNGVIHVIDAVLLPPSVKLGK